MNEIKIPWAAAIPIVILTTSVIMGYVTLRDTAQLNLDINNEQARRLESLDEEFHALNEKFTGLQVNIEYLKSGIEK